MRRPKYLYFRNIFIISFKIGFLFLLLCSFSRNVSAESYSDYPWDDFKAQNDWGRVVVKTKTRLESSVSELKEGLQKYYHIYGSGIFRSQKGGENRDEANKYATIGQGNSQVGFYYFTGKQFFSFVLGPRLLAAESQLVDRNRRSVWDGEAVTSYGINLGNVNFNLEGGRGWQRLDGFGFLFNGMTNYGQMSISKSECLSLSLISLRMKPEEEPLTPEAWNDKRKEMLGGAIRSSNVLFLENFQIFHYLYLEPMHVINPSYQTGNSIYGSYLYSGVEFRSVPFASEFSIDLSLIRTTGIRKQKSYPWTETEQTTSSWLAYGSLHGNLFHFLISLSGLNTRKDSKTRTDSESNGYSAPLAEPRVLGGYSSFLLYQSIYFPNDRIFYEFIDKRAPGFENKGQQIFGLQFGHKIFHATRGDVFLNRSSSELGIGSELILKTTTDFDSRIKGFLSASICYSKVESNKKTVWITEPFIISEKEKEFLRLYLSAGFQF